MESVRVRGCVGGRGSGCGSLVDVPGAVLQASRQADASRRRSGPRKALPGTRTALERAEPGGSRSRCGLEVSPAVLAPSDTARPGEKAGSGGEAARASAGGCGVEDQVGRTDSAYAQVHTLTESRRWQWTSS